MRARTSNRHPNFGDFSDSFLSSGSPREVPRRQTWACLDGRALAPTKAEQARFRLCGPAHCGVRVDKVFNPNAADGQAKITVAASGAVELARRDIAEGVGDAPEEQWSDPAIVRTR